MKYGIISDIHSNLHAYKEALRLLSKKVGVIICLGDIVGYNANPKECIALTKKRKKIKYVIKGNHDEIAHMGLRFSMASSLHRDAYDGLVHTINSIDEKDKEWLYNLPEFVVIKDRNIKFMATHGAPLGYSRYEYIFNKYAAVESAKELWENFALNLCFFGHTHIPTFFSGNINEIYKASFFDSAEFWLGEGTIADLENQTYDISDPGKTYLINPGSIGQPRGASRIHSFVIFDSEKKTIQFECFNYPRDKAIKAIYKAGYSDRIARRLERKSE